MTDRVMLALPSKGAIAEPTLNFLSDCGLKIEKPNPRQYVGVMPALPQVDVLFQRAIDVLYKVSDGTARLGITGYDIVKEYGQDDVVVIHRDLRYGHCNLVVAVPESWIDVDNMVDLAEIALDLRERKGRQMRVATTYPNSTRRFLHASGIHHFTLVNAEGAIEAAPTIGYADIIVDLVQTGTTLRENHLKPLPDGVIIESQACLIGNRAALINDPLTLETVRMIVEQMDAAMNGRGYSQLTVNICGESAEAIGAQLIAEPVTAGLQGPTIAPIYGSQPQADGRHWFTVTVIVPNRSLSQAVEILRRAGGSQITSIPVRYVYLHESPTFAALKSVLSL